MVVVIKEGRKHNWAFELGLKLENKTGGCGITQGD
jgi:hypothetical protein